MRPPAWPPSRAASPDPAITRRARNARRSPICHRALHATFTNKELEKAGDDPHALARHPELTRFLAWIAGKPAHFHAPTRRRRSA
jgi:hypothetical protein